MLVMRNAECGMRNLHAVTSCLSHPKFFLFLLLREVAFEVFLFVSRFDCLSCLPCPERQVVRIELFMMGWGFDPFEMFSCLLDRSVDLGLFLGSFDNVSRLATSSFRLS